MSKEGVGLYTFEDIAFVNTSQFTESARHYKKYKCYTRAPEGSREYKEFWDEEERRRKEGMKAPGKLIYNSRGEVSIQEVHITGKHYGFLNYARIMRVEDEETKAKRVRSIIGEKVASRKTIDFPDFLDGQYHYFKAKAYAEQLALNMIVMKARRKGYSYMEGWDAADDINLIPFITVLIGAYDKKYITKGNQMMRMAKRYLDFLELNTDFARGFLKEDIEEHLKLGYKLKHEGNKEFGFLSEIFAVSFMDNPDAAVGKDAYKIKLEEIGKFPNLKQVLGVTMSTTEDGSEQTGNITMFGTGGTKEANWTDAEDIFYNPDKYNCLCFDNIWDEGARGNSVGFFYPQNWGYRPFVDQHGNSLIKEANADIYAKREEKKKILDSSEYSVYVGQRALCPKESFASSGDSIFPAAEISDQLHRVQHDGSLKNLARIGMLVEGDKGVRFKYNEQLREIGLKTHDPVFDFPLKREGDVHGTYVEWFNPYKDRNTGRIPDMLYRIWCDPYAQDKDKKDISLRDSLGAFYVYERVNNITALKGDVLVASFVGRPSTMDEFNKILFAAAKYFNAQIFFENNRGNIKDYAVKTRQLHLLADEPDLEWDAHLKGKSKVKGKGITMNEARKAKGALYLRDWLMTPRGTDADGNVKLNLHYIYDIGLLRELQKWNSKGNFDRVSALIAGMFDMQECFQREVKVPQQVQADDFFNRPFFT